MRKFFKEFREFAMRGNVMDMAVGIIIGGAFGQIVSSFVADVITPPIGLLLGGVDFSELAITLKHASGDIAPVMLRYGIFIQRTIDFIVIALAVFMIIRIMNMAHRRRQAETAAVPAPEPEPTREERLLAEIRDLLKENKANNTK